MTVGTYSGSYSSLYIGSAITSATITSTGIVDDIVADAFAVEVAGVTLVNAGTVIASASFGVGVYFNHAGILTNTGEITGDFAVEFGFGGTVTNRGTIAGYSSGVFLNGGVLTNAAGGTIEVTGDYGIGLDLDGAVKSSNAGLIVVNVEQDEYETAISTFGVYLASNAFFNNTGVIELVHGYDYPGSFIGITASSGGTVDNSGTITAGYLASGATEHPAAEERHRGARPDGLHLVQNANTGLGIGLYNSTGFNSGLIGATNVGVKLQDASYLGNSGLIQAGPAGVQLVSGTVVNSGTIASNGAQYSAGIYMTGGLLVNAGTIEASGTYEAYGIYANSANPLRIVNERGGVITGLIGVEFFATSGQTLVNAGTIIGTGGTAVNFNSGDDLLVLHPGSAFTGIVDGGAGNNTLELAGGIGIGTLSGFGATVIDFASLAVDYGSSWQLTGSDSLASGIAVSDDGVLLLGGTATLDAAIGGIGTLVLDGTDTLESGAAVSTLDLALAGGTTTLDLDLGFGGSFAASAGTLALGGETLSLTGAAAFTGGTISGSGLLVTYGGVSLAALTLGGGAVWQIYGTVAESGNLSFGPGAATLTAEPGSVFDLIGTGGIAPGAGGSGRITDPALFEKTASTGTSIVAVPVIETGTVAAKAGVLDFTGTGNSFAGTISGAGTVEFGSGTTTLANGLAVTVAHLTVAAGTLTLGGTMTLGNGSGGTTLAITAGGVFDLIVGADIITGGGGTISNAGLLEDTAGTGTIAPGVDNTGKITVTAGTLSFDGAVSGSGWDVIESGGALAYDGPVASGQRVDFAGGHDTLVLDDPAGTGLGFKGLIYGFGGPLETIDLPGFRPGGATLGWRQEGSEGLLTVTDGARHVQLTLFGQYAAAGFSAALDGHGGIAISYHSSSAEAALVSPHH